MKTVRWLVVFLISIFVVSTGVYIVMTSIDDKECVEHEKVQTQHDPSHLLFDELKKMDPKPQISSISFTNEDQKPITKYFTNTLSRELVRLLKSEGSIKKDGNILNIQIAESDDGILFQLNFHDMKSKNKVNEISVLYKLDEKN